MSPTDDVGRLITAFSEGIRNLSDSHAQHCFRLEATLAALVAKVDAMSESQANRRELCATRGGVMTNIQEGLSRVVKSTEDLWDAVTELTAIKNKSYGALFIVGAIGSLIGSVVVQVIMWKVKG